MFRARSVWWRRVGGVLRRWQSGGSVDASEVSKFSALASEWWDPGSKAFGALHAMNAVRVPLAMEALLGGEGVQGPGKRAEGVGARALRGFRVLDVGCGGGILSEALARLGAEVLGVDASAENIEIARQHAAGDRRLDVTYRCTSVEELREEEEEKAFHLVVASEVVEHVREPEAFLRTCAELTAGPLLVTTLNRTPLSFAAAIVAAEYIAGLVPPGTHDWNKFLTPQQLQQALQPIATPTKTVGLLYNPLHPTHPWTFSQSKTAINYAMIFHRNESDDERHEM